MTGRYNISKVDAEKSQSISWFFAITVLLIAMLIIRYSFNEILVFSFLTCILLYVQYLNAKVYNVWFDQGYIHMQNLYVYRKRKIDLFDKVVMTSVFNNMYTIYFENGEQYRFRLKKIDDIKLFLKEDSQYYAKELTENINSLQSA